MARAAGAKAKPKAEATPRVIWVTRTEPGASATAKQIRDLGLEGIVEPLLAVRRLDSPMINLEDVCALAFTSANAVTAFAERTKERGVRVFTVGDATATAARAARFKTVLSAQGDVHALAAALIARRRELKGVILNPGAAEPAGDLVGDLTAAGLRAKAIPVYVTVDVAPSEALAERLGEIDHVLIHSGRAARVLAKFLKTHPAPHLTALAISRAAGRPLSRAGLARIRSAAAPNETALLQLLAPASGD